MSDTRTLVDPESTLPARQKEPYVVQMRNVGKAYKIFGSKLDNFVDALGLDHVMPWYRPKRQEFWALRGIDLELRRGQRIGIVGRNGAGKTTLLKLITGNLSPTTGTVQVKAKVQALIDAGTGFHPDFTGRENIRASLTLQGFSPRQIETSTEDIAEFTELGEFLDRPFKTYSSGMMARLVFATATAIKPEILVIDEILGAGDGYFLGKSNERMRQLVDSGASVLLVSHSMEQITLICDQAIWLDRGRIVKTGASLDVVAAYGQYIRVLEDRRQKARNQKVATRRRLANDFMESYSDTVLLHFIVPAASLLELSNARLFREEALEDQCAVGDAQDSEPTHAAFVVLDRGGWSGPRASNGILYRALEGGSASGSAGEVAFNLFTLYPGLRYSVELDYRLSGPEAALEISHAGVVVNRYDINTTNGEFERARFDLANIAARTVGNGPEAVQAGPTVDAVETLAETRPPAEPVAQTRWPGEGSLMIEQVELLDEDGHDRAVYEWTSPMTVRVTVRATRGGIYPVIPVAVLYRSDGVKVFSHIGDALSLDIQARAAHRFELQLGRLNLGDGHYAFAVAIYRNLNSAGPSLWYDLIDRDYRFEVVGAPPFMGLFKHGGRWTSA
ncbi:MAG TPA: ABC transporter ATP-binding protein [Candidatus Dormibacteraeota bacterium]|nr:ABC transporter ATP-binding protein [Candidatus Dormibacteraeota bacterium]